MIEVAFNPLNFKDVFVNEIAGTPLIAILLLLIAYFAVSSKLKFGFDTTLVLLVPIIIIGGMMFSGFSIIYAFVTLIVAIFLAWIFNRFIENR